MAIPQGADWHMALFLYLGLGILGFFVFSTCHGITQALNENERNRAARLEMLRQEATDDDGS